MQDSSDFKFPLPASTEKKLLLHWLGLESPSDDAANIRLPPNITDPALPTFGAFLASHPVTVISSPFFNESRLHPLRIRPLGLPNSKSQVITSPLSPFAST